MLTRFVNWESLLDNFFLANRERAFLYGRWDCCLFAADAIQVMTGVDVATKFRGRYDSANTAIRRIREYCGHRSVARIAEKLAQEHSMEQAAPGLARRGDMIVVKRPRDYSIGILALNGAQIVIPGKKELLRIPLSFAVTAWRV